MSAPIMLTAHQCEAVSAALEALVDGAPLFAIRGYAGTGKTTLIAPLRDLLRAQGLDSSVGSPTHRAAMVLRAKGIPDASTVHSLALTPYFQGDYAWAHRWLGEDCPAKEAAVIERTPDIDGVPFLLHRELARTGMQAKALLGRASRYGVKKALASLGLHGKQFFDGFGPREGEGVLIIDEASMVGAEMLAMCQKAFPQILLIGDPGQLPPVHDTPALEGVEGVELTEIHRQAAGNPIIALAYAAREGVANWRKVPKAPGQVEECHVADASHFLTSPLIVWRNKTRLECTSRIRDMLGYPAAAVAPGEPLVCRATSAEDRAEGFVNNTLWRVVGRAERDPRRVTVQEEGAEGSSDVLLHLEEVDGDDIDPDAVPFRFGYCVTAHTAQGGEWPRVYISKPDLLAYAGFCKTNAPEDIRRWTYTAITRAKETVVFLTKDLFAAPEAACVTPDAEDKTRTESSAMPVTMQMPESEPANDAQVPLAPLEAPPGIPDDIPDPVTPAAAMAPWAQALPAMPPEAPRLPQAASNGTPPPVVVPATIPALPESLLPLAHGFCQYVQGLLGTQLDEAGIKMARVVDTTVTEMATFTKGVLASNEHAHYSFAEALAKITDRREMPYTVRVMAVSGEGFPLQLTIRKETAGELVEAIGQLLPWLTANGYTAEGAVAA